ncbi:hypothetical protein VPH184E373B_0178 [Vibrio phage 184E37-3b]|nr:hypothetical protein MYOV056v2_p0154 [Vibrio phage 184E37.3a]QZI90152.1 hypothetical protein MYOV057v1_p0237 [Vibrio phage 184E37.1]
MLTKEQKWMNRLQRCLKDMPSDCELLVNASSDTSSVLILLDRGAFAEIDNRMFLHIPEEAERSLEFDVSNVFACSENI